MSDKKSFAVAMFKLLTAYATFIGIIAVIFFLFYFVPRQMSKQTNPTPTVTLSPKGQFCGGIGAVQCINGYACLFDGNYPDAGGTCVKVPKSPDAHVCAFDAKQCADGSYVSRTGPKCEFAPCPN